MQRYHLPAELSTVVSNHLKRISSIEIVGGSSYHLVKCTCEQNVLLSSIQDVCFVFSSSLLAENDYFGCHGMENLFSVEWEARSHEILSTENDGVVIFEKVLRRFIVI